MGMAALLSCHMGIPAVEFKTEKRSAQYPQSFSHIGDHVKARRLDLGLTQTDAAIIIGTNAFTVLNWEKNHTKEPALRLMSGIIKFLGYCPYHPCPTFSEQVTMWRKMHGLSILDVAHTIGIDERTLAKFERGSHPSGRVQRILEQHISVRRTL